MNFHLYLLHLKNVLTSLPMLVSIILLIHDSIVISLQLFMFLYLSFLCIGLIRPFQDQDRKLVQWYQFSKYRDKLIYLYKNLGNV